MVGLPVEAEIALVHLLVKAGAVCEVEDGIPSEDADLALSCWEFHDLLFHTRSREGRQDAPLGATFPQAGRLDLPPALKPVALTEGVDLPRPDLEQLRRQDPPFVQVQEQRRSQREYAAEPITCRQLGEFLYRVARVKDHQEAEIETPRGPMRMEFAARPYPAGGGLYELEVYAAVQVCRDLSSGLYHYDPLGHRLEPIVGPGPEVKQLLTSAALAAGMAAEQLQVLLILTARVPRIAWKYASWPTPWS